MDVNISDNAAEYFTKCARIRGVSRASLFRRLLAHIAKDHMVGVILNDATHMKRRQPSEHRFKEELHGR